MRLLLPTIVLLLTSSCRVASIAEASSPPSAIQWSVDALPWRPGPPTLPAGARVAVLEGNPSQPGIFTMRVQLPAGSRLAPHTHPRPERVTVLSGSVGVGFGEQVDGSAIRRFHAGDYYMNPPDVPHYVDIAETSVVQITGEGPWEIHPID